MKNSQIMLAKIMIFTLRRIFLLRLRFWFLLWLLLLIFIQMLLTPVLPPLLIFEFEFWFLLLLLTTSWQWFAVSVPKWMSTRACDSFSWQITQLLFSHWVSRIFLVDNLLLSLLLLFLVLLSPLPQCTYISGIDRGCGTVVVVIVDTA